MTACLNLYTIRRAFHKSIFCQSFIGYFWWCLSSIIGKNICVFVPRNTFLCVLNKISVEKNVFIFLFPRKSKFYAFSFLIITFHQTWQPISRKLTARAWTDTLIELLNLRWVDVEQGSILWHCAGFFFLILFAKFCITQFCLPYLHTAQISFPARSGFSHYCWKIRDFIMWLRLRWKWQISWWWFRRTVIKEYLEENFGSIFLWSCIFLLIDVCFPADHILWMIIRRRLGYDPWCLRHIFGSYRHEYSKSSGSQRQLRVWQQWCI